MRGALSSFPLRLNGEHRDNFTLPITVILKLNYTYIHTHTHTHSLQMPERRAKIMDNELCYIIYTLLEKKTCSQIQIICILNLLNTS